MSSVSGLSVGDLSAEVTCVLDSLRSVENEVRRRDKAHYTGSLKRLTSLLTSIDASRYRAHEQLEAETITASVLRHKLVTFEQRLQIELEDAVNAVESSVVSQKARLQMCISNVKAAIAQIERRYTALEHHTDELIKQLKCERRNCKELIEEVNRLMTSRAKVKIVLNTTQDSLRSLLSKTERCQRNMEHLAEETKDTCNKFEVDINHLCTTLENIQKELIKTHKETEHLTRELDTMKEDVDRAAGIKTLVQQSLSDYVVEISHKLEMKRQLQIHAKRDVEEMQELTKTSSEFQASNQAARNYFDTEEKRLIEQQHMILRGIEEIEVDVSALTTEQRSVRAALQKETEAKDKHHFSITSTQKSSNTTKETLLFQSEQGARLQREIQDIEYQLKQCSDTHRVTCGLYKDQMLILQQSLEDEESVRKDREAEMAEIDLKNFSLESEQTSQTTHLRTYEERSTFVRTASLEKLSALQYMYKRTKEDQLSLNSVLLMDSAKLQSVTEKMESQSKHLEEQIAILESNHVNVLDAMKAIEPRCTSLEDMKRRKGSMYGSEKENIISMKSKRSGIKDASKHLQDKLKNTTKIQELLRMEIIQQRAHARSQLQCQTFYVENCEHEIAKAKQHLEAVDMENAQIYEVIGPLKLQCSWAKGHCKQVKQCKGVNTAILEVQWTADNNIQKEYVVYCEGVIKRTAVLSTQARRRKEKVSEVYSKMKHETFML